MITPLFTSDGGPGNLHVALMPEQSCICNWEFAKPLQCFLEKHQAEHLADGQRSRGEPEQRLRLAEATGMARSRGVHFRLQPVTLQPTPSVVGW